MIKILGIAAVILSSFLIGNGFALRLIHRQKALAEAVKLCNEVEESIRYTCRPVKDIISDCRQKYPSLSFLETYPKVNAGYPFAKSDCAVIMGFFDGLGKSDGTGQIKHCKAYALQFSRLYDEAQKECAGKNKIYRAMGLALGICAVLTAL